jgi:hypothetical protein
MMTLTYESLASSGASTIVDGYIDARNAEAIGADSTIGGYLTTGDAATLGGNIMVDGNLTAGAAILVGTEAVITRNLRSGAAASADLVADAIVSGPCPSRNWRCSAWRRCRRGGKCQGWHQRHARRWCQCRTQRNFCCRLLHPHWRKHNP